MLQSLLKLSDTRHDRQNTIVQHMNPDFRFPTNIIYDTLCQLSVHQKVCFGLSGTWPFYGPLLRD